MTHEPEDPRSERAKTYQVYIRTSAIGLEVGLSIIVGAVAGYFADDFFGTKPYGVLFGLVAGVLAAAKTLYGFVQKYLKANRDEKNNHDG